MVDSNRTPQPIVDNVPIVKENGFPTQYFMRWCQERQIAIADGITAAQAEQLILDWATQRDITAGVGLSGGGNLSADVNIDLENTAVTPAIYGDATHVAQFTVDQQGRITLAANVPVSGGGGGAPWYFSPPPATAFTLPIGTVPGTATDDANIGCKIDCGAPAGGDVSRGILAAMPAIGTDFTLTVHLVYAGLTNNYGGVGLMLYNQAAANKTIFFCYSLESSYGLQVKRFNYPAGFSATPFANSNTRFDGWFRVQRVGTNLNFYFSNDGKQWILILTESQTAWLTTGPTYIGPGMWYNRTGANNAMTCVVDHWDITTP